MTSTPVSRRNGAAFRRASPDVSAAQSGERPLRIAVVAACPFPRQRGTPVRIQRLAEELQRRGHDVHVVTYPHGDDARATALTVHRVAQVGTRYRTRPGPSISKLLVLDPLLVAVVKRVLRAHDIDIIHAHHYEGLLVSVLARGRHAVPVVYDAHTLLESELPSYAAVLPHAPKLALAKRLDRWLPAQADHVISVTEAIRDRLLAVTRLRTEQITTISNGVECDLFTPPATTALNGHGTVVFTGNLAPYQGIDVLLRAFRAVLASRPDARLVIATDTSFAPYEVLSRSLGVRHAIDVLTTGFSGVPAVLARATIAVNPRLGCDGIPLKLLNYMAASLPVVSFAGSAPGVVHGETGWLVARGDIPGFAAGILALLAQPELAREIGLRARRHVELHHSWEAMSAGTETVLRQVLQRAAGSGANGSGAMVSRPRGAGTPSTEMRIGGAAEHQ
ncbi:MAG TPA: glycosyltransferase family 4 protein [Gemmatimonadaceae bacterium]|nr:glycosyltransferase family 4 protein [Gemmatimonadaceae bacterium]